MASPYFHIKVLDITNNTINLHIVLADDSSGGYDTDKRTIIKTLGYGSDYVGLIGDTKSYLDENINYEEELWNDTWIEENAHRFYTEASIYWEHNHPCEKWTKEQYLEANELIKSEAFPANLFEPLNTIPQCKCRITVTKPEIISHLKPHLMYAYY